MAFLSQVVNVLYMLINSVLCVISWHFFLLLNSAILLPRKLCAFLKILGVGPKTEKPANFQICRFYALLQIFFRN